MKVIPDNGQSSANTSEKSNKTRTKENGPNAYMSTFMPNTQTCSRRSKVQNISSEVYRSSQLRSTLNMGYITALDRCEVCTEAVHSVALRTRVTSQLWTCVKYVPKQSTPSTLNTGYITASDMCEVCTEAAHSVALWARVTSRLTRVNCAPKQSIP